MRLKMHQKEPLYGRHWRPTLIAAELDYVIWIFAPTIFGVGGMYKEICLSVRLSIWITVPVQFFPEHETSFYETRSLMP